MGIIQAGISIINDKHISNVNVSVEVLLLNYVPLEKYSRIMTLR